MVIAAAGGTRKTDIARRLGAAIAVDYTEPGWAEQVRSVVGGINVVFDGVGGRIGAESLDLVGEGGRFVPYGMASGAFTPLPEAELRARRVSVVRSPPRDAGALNDLTRRALAEAVVGRLHAVVGQTFRLDQAADAHAAIASRITVGKTLLLVRHDGADEGRLEH